MGIDPANILSPEVEEDGLWEVHVPAFTAFLTAARQWRTAALPMGIIWLGLDYTAVRAGFELAGLTMTPELWAEVQQIEAGAVRALNGVEE